MLSSAPHLWMILGVALVTLEVMTVPGIGLAFTGMGALSIGVLLYTPYGEDLSIFGQVAWFMGFTIFWTVSLWKVLKRFRMPSKGHAPYSNMVGETAVVGDGGLAPGLPGHVKWSGTRMNAELAHGSDGAPAGAQVEIVEVRGNTLIVRPLH